MPITTATIDLPAVEFGVDPAELAAIAFLARYSGRTLDAYRYDLRNLFQWAADHGLPVLEASRAHLELYRSSMEERGLADSTIDRRLSTACGFYRFAHIDGRISSNPAHYVRRPHVHPSERRGLDRGELGRFLFAAERFDHAHAALAVLLGLNGLRVSEACGTNIEDMAFERRHRVLRIMGKGNKPALIPLVPRTARTIDLAVGERREGQILLRNDGQRLDRRTAHRWVRSIGKRAGIGPVHPHMLRAAFIKRRPRRRRPSSRGPSRCPPRRPSDRLARSRTHRFTQRSRTVVGGRRDSLFVVRPLGGAVADRVELRKLLIVTQTFYCLLAALLWALALADAASVATLVAVGVAGGVVQIADSPARQALVSRLVPPNDLASAVSLNGVVINSARVVGPATAGVLIVTVGTTACFPSGLNSMEPPAVVGP